MPIQEERALIVAFCIERGKDYGLTVETYKVSYQQIIPGCASTKPAVWPVLQTGQASLSRKMN